jgi:hypothetical protein
MKLYNLKMKRTVTLVTVTSRLYLRHLQLDTENLSHIDLLASQNLDLHAVITRSNALPKSLTSTQRQQETSYRTSSPTTIRSEPCSR